MAAAPAVLSGWGSVILEEAAVDDVTVDFAVAAWREDGIWQAVTLPPRSADSLDSLAAALRAQPGEGGVLGLVSVGEEFFVLARVLGEEVRLLVSDLFAAEEHPLGLDALDRLGAPVPDDDDGEELTPAGDLRIAADFGVSMEEVELILDDADLWPDEMLAAIASRAGFGELFDALLESLPD
jgi:putative tRNA adenosine deaminase-associated protein